MLHHPSPNFGDRRGHSVRYIILHYTGMESCQAALTRLCDPQSQVSAHYTIDEDGTIYHHVAEDHRAHHAGVSFWVGQTDINSLSVGVEIVNPGHEFGYRPFPMKQMRVVRDLCVGVMRRHNIPARNVLGHSDVAIARKIDPGELFDWRFLAEGGVGIMPDEPIAPHPPHQELAQKMLAAMGYDVTDLPATITAFQRHYCPTELNRGLTAVTMGALVALSSES